MLRTGHGPSLLVWNILSVMLIVRKVKVFNFCPVLAWLLYRRVSEH